MLWFVFVSVYNVLCYGTLLVTGRCMISIGTVSVSGSEESHLKSLEEHDHRMEKLILLMQEQFSSLMNGSIVGATREHDQNLQTMNETLSSAIDKINKKLNVNLNNNSVLNPVNESFHDIRTEECEYNGEIYGHNDVWLPYGDLDPCFQCTCRNGEYDCETKICPLLRCDTPINHNGRCCPECPYHCRNTSIMCDCSDIKANGHTESGVYRIYVVDEGERYYANASCDMTATNDSWTVFQRRKDGSVDFYRDWYDYANGFGNPNGEFWLGNNFLHLLTSKRRYRLRIDLEDFEGGKRYAEYSTFNISSSADKYTITIGSYSGIAGDGLSDQNGHRFSTKDNDNNPGSRSCSVTFRGAWWYNNCQYSHLNGLYLRGNYSSNGSLSGYEGINWHRWHYQWYSLKTTEMKIYS